MTRRRPMWGSDAGLQSPVCVEKSGVGGFWDRLFSRRGASLVRERWTNPKLVRHPDQSRHRSLAHQENEATFIEARRARKALPVDGKQIVVGLDCEWKPNRHRRQNNKIALLQLCIGNRCLIVQLKHMDRMPDSVKEFLLDEMITFVGVGVGEDVAKLKGNYGLECTKSVDLQQACNEFLGIEGKISKGLKGYAWEILGFEMQKSKNVTQSNWEEWHLTVAQVRYACLDAFVSYLLGCKVLEGKSD